MGHLDSQRSLPTIRPDKGGFSPLAKKLRLTPDHQVAVLLFVNDVAELRRLGPRAIRAAKPNGLLWITYPKGGQTGGATDLPATPWWVQRDVLGEITSEKGYKPVAFVAVDATWTALRFK